MKTKSIKFKIIFSVVGLISFFGILATVATYVLVRNVLSEMKQEDFLVSTIAITHEMQVVFNQSTNLVKLIAEDSRVVDILENSDDASQLMAQLSLGNYNISDHYSAIYFMDQDGNTVDSTDQSFIGKNYSFRDYFRSAIKGKPYLDVAVGTTSKKLGYYFSHPIKNSIGEVIGVAVIKQLPDSIHDLIIDDTHSGGKIMLVDQYGVIIFSNDQDKNFKSLGLLSDVIQEEIVQGKRYGNIEIEPLDYANVLASIPSLDEAQSFVIENDSDGEKVVVVLAQISEMPFYLIGETSLAAAEKYAISTALTISGFVIIASLIASIVISFLINKFLKPLSKLSRTTEAIKAGNLSQRANVKSGDEFEQLANSLNQMTDQLVDEKKDIEKKVSERTQELEELNHSMVGRELKMIGLKKEILELKKIVADKGD